MITITRLPADRWGEYRALRLLALQSDPAAFGSSYEEEKDLPKSEWQDRMKQVLFALDNDELVGMVKVVRESKAKLCHLVNVFSVYVSASYRSKGVGGKLLSAAIDWSIAQKGVRKLRLAVNIENQAARALYEKFGFEIVGQVRDEILVDGKYIDELIMEKYLV